MFRLLLPLTILAGRVAAQTFTNCNPRNSTCPVNPALGTTLEETYNATTTEFNPNLWTIDAGKSLIQFGDDGAQLSLSSEKDTVTLISTFFIFWGVVEFIMKASPGTGLISTVILLSQDLDEIDWEVKGSNTTTVSNNYYGWGNLDQMFSEYPAVDGPQQDFHNYTIDWNAERILFYLNNALVRTVNAAEPGLYPQTPSRVQFGTWCGGCSKNQGTVDWAGGKPDWSGAPYTMTVKSLRVVDGTSNATEYAYGDMSGSAASIKITEGKSKAYKHLNSESTSQKISKQWTGMSTGAKIGIACGIAAAFLLAFVAFGFYCVKQRKEGKLEAAMHDEKWAEQNAELMEYRTMMAKGNFAVSRQSILMDGKMEQQVPLNRGRI
ncbi:related to cell wall glucanase [Ramularia collo-cygni]|uniref:chitinase n=1 Tax=Ramularia collo-cygni TaxID=112498 RepID=A0A2D3VC23_9PEZI|nr:related to cell wall glucanase [Ramularia collo-cygni]CZT23245.1 related to cell wall glucanase [Ramularia collo-cygni]